MVNETGEKILEAILSERKDYDTPRSDMRLVVQPEIWDDLVTNCSEMFNHGDGHMSMRYFDGVRIYVDKTLNGPFDIYYGYIDSIEKLDRELQDIADDAIDKAMNAHKEIKRKFARVIEQSTDLPEDLVDMCIGRMAKKMNDASDVLQRQMEPFQR